MLALWCGAAPARAAADLETQVLDLARRSLLEQAEQAGWVAPEVQVTLPAAKRSTPPCPAGWDVAVQDLRSLLRLRLVARCADARVPPQDFLLRATVSAEVLVLAQAVPSGQEVGDADVQLQRRDVSQTPDALAALEPGLAARSGLRPGQLLQKRLLVAAVVVKRGDAVRIQASRDGVAVEAPGEALDSGARQALIRVRNANSGRIVQARVIGPGLVEPASLR